MRLRRMVLVVACVLLAAFGTLAAVSRRAPPPMEAPFVLADSQRLYAQQASLVRVAFNDHQVMFALLGRLWELDPGGPGWAAFGAELSGGERAFANRVVLPALRAAAGASGEKAVDFVVPLPMRWAASGSPFGLPWSGTLWLLVRPPGDGGVR